MWFSRRNQGTSAPEQWWSLLFSPSQYEDFLGLVRAYFEKRGEQITIDDGAILRIVGNPEKPNMGLYNLAQLCHQAEYELWPAILEEHFENLSKTEAVLADLKAHKSDFSYAASHLTLRLYPQEGFATPETKVFSTNLEGTVLVLMFDFPSSVHSVAKNDAAVWGKTDEELLAIGMSNVRKNHSPKITSQMVRKKIPVVLFGEYFYAATYALCLDEYPQCLGKYGALVGIPHRSALIVYPVNDASVLDVVHELIGLIGYMYKEGPGSISSLLYWYYQGRYYAFHSSDAGKKLHISPPQEFLSTVFPDNA